MNKSLKLTNIIHKKIGNDTLLCGYPPDKTIDNIKKIVLGVD
jgi:hypothetical protein